MEACPISTPFTCHGRATTATPTHPQPLPPPPQHLSFPRQRYWRPMMRASMGAAKTRRLSARANAQVEMMQYHSGRDYYLDEQDVVTFLDPPKELIPLDPSSYNPASYLWKKIEAIPEERRHHLLSLLSPRLISMAWEIAGRRYEDPKLVNKSASSLLSGGHCARSLEFWNCRTSGAPLGIAWINSCQKAIFRGTDGKTYGRLIGGRFPLSGILNATPPLYFSVQQVKEVTATEQPCDIAYEFGDGVVNLAGAGAGAGAGEGGYLQGLGFPKPSKHPWPWNDEVVVYVREVGPGVAVGQAWQEGVALQQLPKKLCNEMLMVTESKSETTGLD
ncbi:uncharacterized protein LOC127263044 [Andrographis paniculata]|uniref:uncharacterized protein LOC127263044 n=1 Tax=Andrographis paniculata TaxID=175694 RepID=UPI0021E96EA6|nr:uncharacterized protein LOC127263044 [Andrographis paniculata]